MLFAQNFDIFIPKTAAKMPEIIIVPRIMIKFCEDIVCRISLMAAAEPERALLIAKIVMKLKPMIIVFVAPTRKRKPLVSC